MISRPACVFRRLSAAGGGDEVDQLLDPAEERGLQVSEARHGPQDALPAGRDVLRPPDRAQHAFLPRQAAGDIGPAGDPEHGIKAGTRWEDVPAKWACPDCGVAKADFEMVLLAA